MRLIRDRSNPESAATDGDSPDDLRDPFYIGTLPDREDDSFVDVLHAARVEWQIEGEPFVFRGDMERAFISSHARRYVSMNNSLVRHSVPYRKETAAMAEAAVRVANKGLLATLFESGAPLPYWDHAWCTWVINYNAIHCDVWPRTNSVPRRHLLPFGVLGHCVLPHEVYRPKKVDPGGTPVVFLGYMLDTAQQAACGSRFMMKSVKPCERL